MPRCPAVSAQEWDPAVSKAFPELLSLQQQPIREWEAGSCQWRNKGEKIRGNATKHGMNLCTSSCVPQQEHEMLQALLGVFSEPQEMWREHVNQASSPGYKANKEHICNPCTEIQCLLKARPWAAPRQLRGVYCVLIGDLEMVSPIVSQWLICFSRGALGFSSAALNSCWVSFGGKRA